MNIDWTLEIKTEDGLTLFENDAVVECEIDEQNGEYFVEVTGFEIEPYELRNMPKEEAKKITSNHFHANSKQAWKKLLFFHVKEDLEVDQSFIDHVLDKEDLPLQDPNDEHRLRAFELL